MRARIAPVLILTCGLLAAWTVRGKVVAPLRVPLELAVPPTFAGMAGEPLVVRDAELQNARTTSFVARGYRPAADTSRQTIEVHVCYYDHKGADKWEHAPRLCHMNPMWAIVSVTDTALETDRGPRVIRQFVLLNGQQRAVAIYWQQWHDRTVIDAIAVRKHRLLKSVLHRRSEEALARVLVPVHATDEEALATARTLAAEVITGLDQALPR